MRVAEFVTETAEASECLLCPNHCRVVEGKLGRCLGRGRKDGKMRVYNYAIVVAAHLDPIEKKPLYHFFPGREILSVGTFGCNLACRFCQNFEMSQEQVPGEYVEPAELVRQAEEMAGNVGIAFTYNEPGIWYEYVIDVAPLLRAKGLKVVLVTNGYMNPEPWKKLCELSDAMNIDLKGFSEDFYHDTCKGKLQPVLDNIVAAHAAGVKVELTNLVVTDRNTDVAAFEKMVDWISGVSPAMPLHISRYFPRFHETAPPTPENVLDTFYQKASEKLLYVYVGNIQRRDGNDTRCPGCGKTWVSRHGYHVQLRQKTAICECGRGVDLTGIGAH